MAGCARVCKPAMPPVDACPYNGSHPTAGLLTHSATMTRTIPWITPNSRPPNPLCHHDQDYTLDHTQQQPPNPLRHNDQDYTMDHTQQQASLPTLPPWPGLYHGSHPTAGLLTHSATMTRTISWITPNSRPPNPLCHHDQDYTMYIVFIVLRNLSDRKVISNTE